MCFGDATPKHTCSCGLRVLAVGLGRSKPKGDCLGAAGAERRAVRCSTWFLPLLSALLCAQLAEAHRRVPVLARGGLQDGCGLSQQRED